jgi:hypothetical protein
MIKIARGFQIKIPKDLISKNSGNLSWNQVNSKEKVSLYNLSTSARVSFEKYQLLPVFSTYMAGNLKGKGAYLFLLWINVRVP